VKATGHIAKLRKDLGLDAWPEGPCMHNLPWMTSSPEFPAPYIALTRENASALENEAQHEIGRGHSLKGLRLNALAKCEACDNVVFQASDETWAVVHLTWKGSGRYDRGPRLGWLKRRMTRERPPWPWTEHFDSIEALMRDLGEDHH
jgi:hypothetical protein